MDVDEDDCMEIDDSIPEGSIRERKSEDLSSISESLIKDQTEAESSVPPAIVSSESEAVSPAIMLPPPAIMLPPPAVMLPPPAVMLPPPAVTPPTPAEEPPNNQALEERPNLPDPVVILDDDESDEGIEKDYAFRGKRTVEIEPKEIIDLVEKPNNRCLNTICDSTSSDFISAPDFCLSYYRVKRSRNHNEEICEVCYNKSIQDFDKLATNLKSGKLTLECDYPVINETVQIEDSDDEEDEKELVKEYISKENFEFISENIDDIIMKTLEEYKIDQQCQLETDYLKKEAQKLEDDCADLSDQVSDVRNLLDKIQLDLYNQFRPDFRNLKGISIVDDFEFSPNVIIKSDPTVEVAPRKSARSHRPVSYVELDEGSSNSPKVPPVTTDTEPPVEPPVEPPADLPPVIPIDRNTPQVGEIYYVVRENTPSSWIRCRLQAIINPGTSYNSQTFTTVYYKLVELKQQKDRLVDGKQIAYLTHSKARLPVGTRVISVFKETNIEDESKKPKLDPYYAGIVAEQPFEGNKYRYLIFFDIGYSQYVSFKSVNLVLESSPNVWEDIYEDSRSFIKKYLESQDRPMVKLAKDQTVRVEYNGKWWLCTIVDVDCSLVQVFFEALNRTEWIYRGSTRLSPMYREEQAATNRHTGLRTSRKLGPNESQTVVQYTRKDDFVPSGDQESPTASVRAVARKSTTRPQANIPVAGAVPFLPQVNPTPVNTTGPTSKIMYFTPRDQVIIRRQYKPHNCGQKCKEFLTHNFSQLRGHNPLSKPLLCGWGRMTHKAKGRKEIIYKAPCGRILRNIAEVHMYLMMTKSEMTVDLFDFNHMVRCLAEFSVDCNPDPKDLSRGMEQVPIPVINGINNEMLDFCNYSIKRVPMEGVHMNLETEFLCGCDCDDDCIDKTKCACWKLTLEGAKYIGKDIDPNSVGYIYRRLPEQVITGIYECNSRCKCSSTCLNRVVQNPMSLKLQVFRTLNRGWGIRCLNDVPQGSFICIYAGTIHTEAMANEDGMAYGDEYFAELDYIETVEKYKEDYEAEVIEEEDEEELDSKREKSKSPVDDDDDEDEAYKRIHNNNPKYRRYNYSEDNDFTPSYTDRSSQGDSGIRTRLRRRYDDPTNKKTKKEESKSGTSTYLDALKIKKEIIEGKTDLKATVEALSSDIETVTISDEEDEGREVLSFNPKGGNLDDKASLYVSVREMFGKEECVYVMDAKNAGNIGRFLNHSCSPNVFVQNVFVDTHDPRFPWVSFFSSQFIRAGTELTWNYNYDIGSVPGRVLYCHCSSLECKGRLL